MSGDPSNERSALLTVDALPRDVTDTKQGLSGTSSSSTLCDDIQKVRKGKEKRFPWRFAISLYILTCITPLAFELIFPFVNQMILENGTTDDPESVGFYSGLIESIFTFTSFLSIMPCTLLSDHIGRRPVILVGTLGLAISTAFFGLSKTYRSMILTRMIGGTLGGTNATMRVMLTETIDKSQQGLAFSGSVIAYRMGQIIGQPMGGLLSHPERRLKAFDSPFWRDYPFALPCFIASAIALLGVSFGFFYIEETLPSKRRKRRHNTYGSMNTIESEQTRTGKRASTSVRSILTPQVVGALISSSFLAFASEAIFSLFPLFAFTPIESGGLGYSEAQTGIQLGLRSVNNVLVILLYAPLEKRIGTSSTFKLTMAFWPLSIAFLPLLNTLARCGWEGTWAFQVILFIFVTFWSFACLSWTASAIVINNSAPCAEALAVVNGVGQMALTLPTAVAPAIMTSLFAFSIEHEFILKGNLIYVILLAISVIGSVYTLVLKEPTHDWRADFQDEDANGT